MTRRDALKAGAGLALAPAAASATPGSAGRLKQSIARWCYRDIPIEDLCRHAADLGVSGLDLVGPEDWPTLRKYGLTPAMVQGAVLTGKPGAVFDYGWNHKEYHDQLEEAAKTSILRAAEAKVSNVITLFGARRGMSDDEGIGNCIVGLNRVKKFAEDHGVTLCIELLNSKVDHKDYQGDHTAYGVAVIQGVDSPRVKLLYDAYHMQIMEGDLIRTIRENIQYIAHFHCAGVPGRHEIDETQEVNWHAVANAIADLNFTGFIAQEFVPAKDPLTSLKRAVEILTV
ncbi:MAG TPA: TIM barrel protein [Bryobacteraceae bacterium]|nr:TIM barrel protein [Bryobacteraceae bacterium]